MSVALGRSGFFVALEPNGFSKKYSLIDVTTVTQLLSSGIEKQPCCPTVGNVISGQIKSLVDGISLDVVCMV